MRPGTFEPSRHGFPFSARFIYPGSLLGLAAPLSPDFGLGGGMCWAALDRYLADRQLPALLERPRAGEPLYMELVQRQANTLANAGWAKLTEWQRRPDVGARFRPGVAELTRREWRRVKRRLDRGLPVLLFVIRARGPFANPSENRQVLAYRYQVDGGRLTLWVYDPLRPGSDGVRLGMNLSRRLPLDASFGERETVRGFFAVPYDRQAPQQLQVHVPVDPREGAPRLAAEPPAAIAAPRGRLHAFARDDEGNLLHYRRNRSGRWRVRDLTRRRKHPAEVRLATRPVPLAGVRPRLFARGPGGGLLEYRKRRLFGWSARNITSRRSIGERFRFEGEPVALSASSGEIGVFAIGEGRLLHYRRTRMGRWSAENLSGRLGQTETLHVAGHPVACLGADRAENVLTRNPQGELLHFRRARNGKWQAENATLRVGGWDAFRIASDPVPLPVSDAMHVFGLTSSGEPVQYRRGENGRWRARKLTSEVTGDAEPHRMVGGLTALEALDGTLHLFGVGTEGGLVHYWWLRGEWQAEDLTVGRATIGDEMRLDGPPSVARGPGSTLHVLARRGTEVLLYRWSHDSDWVAENLTRDRWSGSAGVVGGDPQALVDAHDRLHVLMLDPENRLQHAGRRSASHATWQITLIRAVGSVADALRPIPDAIVAVGVAIVRRLRPARRQSPLLRATPVEVSLSRRGPAPPSEDSVWAQAQAVRRAEAEHLEELERRADAARQAEAARLLELERQAEQERQAELARRAEAARLAELERQAEEARRAEEQRRTDAAWQEELAKQSELETETASRTRLQAEADRLADAETARRAELEAEAARRAAADAEAGRKAAAEAESARRAAEAERERQEAQRLEPAATAEPALPDLTPTAGGPADEGAPIELPAPVVRRRRRPVDPDRPPFVPPAASPAWLEELFPDRPRPAPGAEAERERRRRQLLALENILRLAEQYSGDTPTSKGSTTER